MNTTLALAQAAAEAGRPWVEGGGPWASGFGWLFFLVPLFWIGIFFLFAAIFGRRWRRSAWEHGYGGPGHGGQHFGATRSAEASLAERFAQGDIDEKEYRARLEVLRANTPRPPSK